LRVIFAKIGIYHVLKDRKFLFGYGLGDVQHHLDYYYMSYNLAPNWYEGFNLHNQYIQYLVTYGVLTLLIFVYYLIQSLIISIKGDNVLHLFFMIMIMFLFIFEVYLARNKGIVLLFFFNTLFLTQKFKFESSHTRYERCT
jgi:O-antigen ligase